MRALITGAGGFVGKYLVAHLGDEGDEVVAIDRAGDGAADLSIDITNRDATFGVIAEAAPDVVYHLAALTHVGESWLRPNAVLRVNVEGTKNVLDASIAAGVDRVVTIGSAEEYGIVDSDSPVTEAEPLRPATPYGVSKLAASFLALQAFLSDGLGTIRVRPFNHTGPGQLDRFLVPALAAKISAARQHGADHILVGNLDPVRDWSDVRDVVRAYRVLAQQGTAGEVYNIASGVGVSVREIAERLLGVADAELELRPDPNLVRAVDTPRLVGSTDKVRRDTAWEPTFSLTQTLTDVYDHIGPRS